MFNFPVYYFCLQKYKDHLSSLTAWHKLFMCLFINIMSIYIHIFVMPRCMPSLKANKETETFKLHLTWNVWETYMPPLPRNKIWNDYINTMNWYSPFSGNHCAKFGNYQGIQIIHTIGNAEKKTSSLTLWPEKQ